MFSLRASLFAGYISNSETKDSPPALWNTGHELNALFCEFYRGRQRDTANFGIPDRQTLGLPNVVSEYQH